MMSFLINILGVLLIVLIAWWFWAPSKKK
ncbi:hypothetical protein [Marinomonas flavescens]